MAETVLVLSGQGIPPYSARGCSQTLTPISEQLAAVRTVNGTLIDMSDAGFRKYASSISCDDMNSPAVDGIWPGMVLTVDCIVELAYKLPEDPEEEPGENAERTVVSGSVRTVGDYLFYRPQLSMMIMNFEIEKDEWGAAVGWTLDLEEV